MKALNIILKAYLLYILITILCNMKKLRNAEKLTRV